MRIRLLTIGKTKEAFIREGTRKYLDRLGHYCRFEMNELPDVKLKRSKGPEFLREEEGKTFLKQIDPGDLVVLLDEKGKQYSSKAFAAQIQSWMNRSPKSIVFIIGGAFGFSDDVYNRADVKVGLSKMTYTHDMCRLVLVEQVYRAMTILRGESYHH